MPRFSEASQARLATCHPDLQWVFNTVIERFDCTIVQGHRSVEEQQELYAQGRTKPGRIVTQIDGITKKSKHNYHPSMAVDVVPYPVDWADRERMIFFAGYVIGVADELGVDLRWGGDWNQNTDLSDNNFDDLPHFEIAL